MQQATTTTGNGQQTLAERLARLGYEPGVPDFDLFPIAGVDAAVAAGESCPDCGHAGLALLPMQCGKVYAALTLCPRCGAQHEQEV